MATKEELDSLRIENANNVVKEHFVEGEETFPMIHRIRYALYDNFYIDVDTKKSKFEGNSLSMSEPQILSDSNTLEMFDFASDSIENPEEYTKVIGVTKTFVLEGWHFDYPCHFDGLNYTRDGDWDKYTEGYPPTLYFDRNVVTGETYYTEIQEPTFVSESGTPLNSIIWNVKIGLEDEIVEPEETE